LPAGNDAVQANQGRVEDGLDDVGVGFVAIHFQTTRFGVHSAAGRIRSGCTTGLFESRAKLMAFSPQSTVAVSSLRKTGLKTPRTIKRNRARKIRRSIRIAPSENLRQPFKADG
jgi:hypothetical protein